MDREDESNNKQKRYLFQQTDVLGDIGGSLVHTLIQFSIWMCSCFSSLVQFLTFGNVGLGIASTEPYLAKYFLNCANRSFHKYSLVSHTNPASVSKLILSVLMAPSPTFCWKSLYWCLYMHCQAECECFAFNLKKETITKHLRSRESLPVVWPIEKDTRDYWWLERCRARSTSQRI